MDVRNETHIIHSCSAAGWEKYLCHSPGSKQHVLIHQGRQLCSDKEALSCSPGKFQAHFKMFLEVLR